MLIRVARGGVGLLLTLMVAAPSLSAAGAPARARVVSYVTGLTELPAFLGDVRDDSSSSAWRLYDPASGRDSLFLRIKGVPMPIHWDRDFHHVYFAASGAIWTAEWKLGSTPERLAPFPPAPGFCDFWQDSATGALHAVTSQELDVRAPAVSRVWERPPGAIEWRLALTDSIDCRYGGCSCADPAMARFRKAPSVKIEDLLDSMRIENHPNSTIREVPTRDNEEGGWLVYVSSTFDRQISTDGRVGAMLLDWDQDPFGAHHC